MIRDLQEEIRQVRNLAEATAHLVSRLPGYEQDIWMRSLIKVMEEYQTHRCDRFEQEVKDAEAILEKNYRCHGYDQAVGSFVPRKWWNDLHNSYIDLQHEYDVLKEEITVLKKKLKKKGKKNAKKRSN